MAMIKGHHFPGGKTKMPKSVPQPAASPPRKNVVETIEVRPIDNGYLIEKRSYSTGPGPYKSKISTVYSPTKPKIGV